MLLCKELKTTGIKSVPLNEMNRHVRKNPPRCSGLRENFGTSGSSHCSVCYQKRRDKYSDLETSTESKKDCKKTRKGCKTCNRRACKECWSTFDHKPAPTSPQCKVARKH